MFLSFHIIRRVLRWWPDCLVWICLSTGLAALSPHFTVFAVLGIVVKEDLLPGVNMSETFRGLSAESLPSVLLRVILTIDSNIPGTIFLISMPCLLA